MPAGVPMDTSMRFVAANVRVHGLKDAPVAAVAFAMDDPTTSQFSMLPAEDPDGDTDASVPAIAKSYANAHGGLIVFNKPLTETQSKDVPILMTIRTGGPVKVRVTLIDIDGNPIGHGGVISASTSVTMSVHDPVGAPNTGVLLFAPQPNPSSNDITIRYWLPRQEPATLEIRNVLGQTVATVFGATGFEGNNVARYSVRTLPQGTYFLRLASPSGESAVSFVIIH